MQFRRQALARQQLPDELELPVRYARPQGLLVLVVVLLIVGGGGAWAVTGSVSGRVDAPGILTYGQGSHTVQSPVGGQVTKVYAREGRFVKAGAALVRVRTRDGDRAVRALDAGRVSSLRAGLGTIVSTGSHVATVERTGEQEGKARELRAILYVPAGSAASVPKGAAVDLTVQSAPRQQYGVLRGTVESVGSAPQSREQIAAFLGDAQLGEEFTRGERPVPVVVRLRKSPGATGRYEWSTSRGSSHPLSSMTLADGSVRLAAQRPVDWLIP
ncbi:HlyD family efflux transporter periplasmic adaptor subunit [Streptomyces armeniacus]|uniref:HlyD family efflux transporter periplasmic adaptor subunit n=1 Tax=Streptomyces armeniacus TaxID=83291 RepID=A0A345XPJ1_9ACTN|nr:HlyD family efflux transporter periplasmic adaptor subunit [Streptomyces armeniacus]AXK33557.1 HlyD family efflux transporter periplasmic adaptor subunit [Streptomyces armeniacus]